MTEFSVQNPACRIQLDSSVESSQSSPTDSSEHEMNLVLRPARRYNSRGRKRQQPGQCQRVYSLEDEEDKRRRRAKKERTRVSNLAVAYQTLARTIGLYPLRGSQKRITHEQILQGANKLITELKQELEFLRKGEGRVMVVNTPPAPVYTPAKHYTISSSGEIVVVDEPGVNHMDQLDLSCDETLPLPTLDESDGSSDIPMNMQRESQTSTVPLLNFELVSPSTSGNHSSVTDAQIQHILGLNGESSSISTLKQGFLLSPQFTPLNTVLQSSCFQAYSSPVDVGAYEEIVNEEIGTPSNPHLLKGSIGT